MRFAVGIFLLKTIVEGLFLFNVLLFFERKQLILYLPFAEFFHILYVIIIGIWAQTGSYKWKDRQLKNQRNEK